MFVFQVIASVLRNLSWRADVNSKKTLREVGSVRALMGCALEVQKVIKTVFLSLFGLSFCSNQQFFSFLFLFFSSFRSRL